MGQNPTTASPTFPQFFTPIIYFQWQGLSTTVTLTRTVDRLWRLIVQRTLFSSRYTGKFEICYKLMFFICKLEMKLQRTQYFESIMVKQ